MQSRVRGEREAAEARAETQALRREVDMGQVRIHVKRRMMEAGLTQTQLARRARISPGSLSLWLKGVSELSPENLLKLSGAIKTLSRHAPTAQLLAEVEALAVAP